MPQSVLLADDHPIVRQGLHALLEREGLDVVGGPPTATRPWRLRGSTSRIWPSSIS
jgi:DNA-binding NarL/FixJ family response regulator